MEPSHSGRVPWGTPQLDFSGYFASSALSDCTISITTVEADEQPSTPAAKRAKGCVAAGNAGTLSTLRTHVVRVVATATAGVGGVGITIRAFYAILSAL